MARRHVKTAVVRLERFQLHRAASTLIVTWVRKIENMLRAVRKSIGTYITAQTCENRADLFVVLV